MLRAAAISIIFLLASCGGEKRDRPDATAKDSGGVDGAIAKDAGDTGVNNNDTGVNDTGINDTGVNDTGINDTGINDTGVNDTGVNDTGINDTGVVDTGPGDTGPGDGPVDGGFDGSVDAGLIDAGGPLDTGVVDTGGFPDAGLGPCMVGEEGCNCTSTATTAVLLQDNCQTGLLCAPWDVMTGQVGNLTGPVQSCARPCTVDSDCGAGRFCGETSFAPATGLDRMCFTFPVDVDQFCGVSRNTISRLPGVAIETQGLMLGCRQGTCQIGVFGDVHPDEGVCLEICQNNSECGQPRPYCNPIFAGTGTTTQGVCSTAALGPGAICGTSDITRLGLTSRCDAAATSPVRPARGGCVATNLYNGEGFCGQFCGSANPCEGADETGAFICNIFDATDTQFGGFCDSACTSYPENCSGPGRTNDGRLCADNLLSVGGTGINFCMDRRGPALSATIFNTTGTGIQTQGDTCDGGFVEPLLFTRCPDSTVCASGLGGQLVCGYGCARTSTVPQGGCAVVSNTAVCTTGIVTANPNNGGCGDL